MEWSDRIGSRERRAWLLLIDPDGVVTPFLGKTIPGVVTVTGESYTKNGKWSHTTYRFALFPRIRALAGRDGWEQGTFAEGLASATATGPLDTWAQVANALGVSISQAQKFLRAWRPRAADALDVVEASLDAVAEAVDVAGDEEVVTLSLSFGAPTRRQRDDGYWTAPVRVVQNETVLATITPAPGGWGPDAQIDGDPRVRVLAVERSSGHGGGYVSLRVAAPALATLTR